LVFSSLVLCPVLGLLLVKENISSHIHIVMSVLVQVASHSGHVTGQVYTKVLFTVCYRSKFCLELSKFLLSFVYILKSLGIGLFSLVMSLCVFFIFGLVLGLVVT